METVIQYIVLLWILPMAPLLLALLLFPLWWSFLGLRSTFIAFFAVCTRILSHSEVHHRLDLRRTPRRKTHDLRAEISDGQIIYNGLVSDISEMGLCIRDIPASFSSSRTLLSIIVRNGTRQQRIVARPRWQHRHPNRGKIMGAEIAMAPVNWSTFIASF